MKVAQLNKTQRIVITSSCKSVVHDTWKEIYKPEDWSDPESIAASGYSSVKTEP